MTSQEKGRSELPVGHREGQTKGSGERCGEGGERSGGRGEAAGRESANEPARERGGDAIARAFPNGLCLRIQFEFREGAVASFPAGTLKVYFAFHQRSCSVPLRSRFVFFDSREGGARYAGYDTGMFVLFLFVFMNI
jgi:hypothetical protein